MGLTAELNTQLDAGSLGQTLVSGLGDPLTSLSSISPPASSDQIQGATGGVSAIDSSPIGGAASALLQQAGPLIGSLPVAGELMGPLESVIGTVEGLVSQDLAASIAALGGELASALESAGQDGLVAALLKVAEALTGADQSKLLFDLISRLTTAANIQLPSFPGEDILKALDGTSRAVGGMMALETILAEADRLSASMAAFVDVPQMQASIAALRRTLDGDSVTLAAFLDGLDGSDPAAVSAAAKAVLNVAGNLETVSENLSAAMGMGEASLAYMDMTSLQAEVEIAAAMVRTADLGPLQKQMTAVAALLQPYISFDLTGIAVRTVDQLLDDAEAKVDEVAAALTSLDVAQFVSPLSDGIAVVADFIASISNVVTQITVAFRSAMEAVRSAVTALPLGEIADAIHRFLDPVTQVINAIHQLLDDIETALNAAAGVATGALGQIDGLLTKFKGDVDALFAGARKAVDAANLDQVAGAIQDNIKKFSGVLAKAQLKPYFDTAKTAIGDAADVISKVPLSLLPDSMKADVDAAVAPIKNTDANELKTGIESLLEIGPDGKFALRGDLEAAIAQVQTQYEALLQTIKDHDPRTALQSVDDKLKEIAQRVRQIEPALTLQPVQDAVDQVKGVIAGIDLDAMLKPVTDIFTKILAAIDEYSPATLLQPFEQRLTDVRQKLLDGIQLDQWKPALDDLRTRILGLLEYVDPVQLEPLLHSAFDEIVTLAGRIPQLNASNSMGTLVATLLSATGLRVAATTFETVVSWTGSVSGSAALNAHAAHIADAIALTRDAVQTLDIQAIGTEIGQKAATLRASVQALIGRLSPTSQQAIDLTVVLPRLDAEGLFGALQVNTARFLDEVASSASLALTLKATGFSEVDATAHNLALAVAPLKPAADFLNRILSALGLSNTGGGIAGIVTGILAAAPPERITGIVMPLFTAARDRLNTLLNAILDPIDAAIDNLKKLIDAIDLKPIQDAITSVIDEVKAQIDRLNPATLLKDPIDAFKALQTDLVQNDPMKKVLAIITAIRDAISAVAGKLQLETLLATPLAIYDTILSDLEKINVEGLLNPVFDQIDQIAQQVDTGLTDTVAAFQRLQASLPSDAGGGGGAALAAAGSVGIG